MNELFLLVPFQWGHWGTDELSAFAKISGSKWEPGEWMFLDECFPESWIKILSFWYVIFFLNFY